MKTGRNLLLALLPALAVGVIPASAQDAEEGDVIYQAQSVEIVGIDPTLREIISLHRPVTPQTAQEPKFAIHTRDNKFILSIGGVINPILGFDLGNDLYDATGKSTDFITGDIPVPSMPGHKSTFFINPFDSYLDFTIVGFGGTENQVTGYVKLSLNGANNHAILKRAYVSWRHITVGETATIFKDDLAATPPTIDSEGPCGMVSETAHSLNYKSPEWDGFSFAVGVEMPTFYSSNGVYRGPDYNHHFYDKQVTEEASQVVPDVPFYLQYQASRSNRIRLSGLMRNFAYRNLVAGKTRHLVGWGAMVSGNFSFYEPLVFNFQAVYGKGIANYIQDIQGRQISFTPKDDEIGRMESNPMMGLTFGASYNATKKLQFNLVGSYARVWDAQNYAVLGDQDGVAGSNNYRYAVYGAANCFYSFTKYLQWGMEYVYGRRATYELGAASDHRIQTQLIFSF